MKKPNSFFPAIIAFFIYIFSMISYFAFSEPGEKINLFYVFVVIPSGCILGYISLFLWVKFINSRSNHDITEK
jgi:hypothetical protein